MDKKKKVKANPSYDSLNSVSLAPQPHLPSTIYNPNPFPLDPTQPDGLSRHNAFYTERETREAETVDIEIEETKGFVSGKSRESVDLDNVHNNRRDSDIDMEYDLARKTNTIQRLGAGLKGALVKSGLTRNRDKEPEKQVDAVLQHHLQQQRELRRQQQQQREQDPEMGSRIREGERQTESAHLYSDRVRGDEDLISPRVGRRKQDPFTDRRTRPQSLSPPPGQDRGNSAMYWPEGRRDTRAEQMVPFIGYQPPLSASPRRFRPQHQQQQRPARPLSQPSDSDYRGFSRHALGDPESLRERDELDRRRREALVEGPEGVRRHSDQSRVANADSAVRAPSEFGDDEESVSANLAARQTPDRLSRAREWVANNSRINAPTTPPPVFDRETVISSLPGAPSSRSSRRISVDGYGLVIPQRGGYMDNAGRGYESRERVARMNQVETRGIQRTYRNSMADDGQYWRRQMEGYDQRRQIREEYRREKYDYSARGGFAGYPPGGPDDVEHDGAESTIAAISALKSKQSIESSNALKKTTDKKAEADAGPSTADQSDEEVDPLASPKVPNKKRLILRLVSLFCSLFVLVFLIAAAPVSVDRLERIC